MEKKKELKGKSTGNAAWERELAARVDTADRYDREIETCADYRPRDIVYLEQVWKKNAKDAG